MRLNPIMIIALLGLAPACSGSVEGLSSGTDEGLSSGTDEGLSSSCDELPEVNDSRTLWAETVAQSPHYRYLREFKEPVEVEGELNGCRFTTTIEVDGGAVVSREFVVMPYGPEPPPCDVDAGWVEGPGEIGSHDESRAGEPALIEELYESCCELVFLATPDMDDFFREDDAGYMAYCGDDYCDDGGCESGPDRDITLTQIELL